jgi:integrase
MSRLTARKRWVMAGPWPHPKTGILYYRKVTPPDLWAERARLATSGIKVTREVQRSLGTKDQRPAERRYLEVATEQEEVWAGWRDLLRDGPRSLSHKQATGLAADYARAFLAKHEEEPFDVPPAPPIPLPDGRNDDALAKMEEGMPPAKLAALRADLMEYLKASGKRRRVLGVSLLESHPNLAAVVGSDLAAALETMHGADTGEATTGRGVHLDASTRRMVNLGMAGLMGAARRGLEARQGGNYGSVAELDAAPTFDPSKARGGSAATDSPETEYPSLIYLLHHKAKKGVRPATLRDDEGYLRKFIKSVGHHDATRVTKADVRDWRDGLMAQTKPALAPRTINNKYLSALKAVLSHGVKEFDLPANVADDIMDGRDDGPKRRREWTPEEAVTILKATFKGSSKDISEPHRRAVFWAPWIAAYTGLRISEVTQLRGIDLKHDYGFPHLIVSPEARNTKSDRAWSTGIHKHLIEMGMLDFIQNMGDGPLFYEPLDKGKPLNEAQRRSRVAEAANRVTNWVKDELGMTVYRPNHAWRHLFTTRSRQCRMDKETRDYMLGSRSKTDARESYGEWTPDVTDREINRQERFAVVDTGERPYGASIR